MSTDLLVQEHSAGLHRHFTPHGCPTCPARPPSVAVAPVALPERRVSAGFTSLGEAIERVVQRRGRAFGDGRQPDPEPPQAADGNPWCERCRGARRLAIRESTEPTRYVACPDCQSADWAIDRRRGRLRMSVPVRFSTCRLQTFPTRHAEQSRVIALLGEWLAETEPTWLFLWGPTGRGKTGLAAALLYELCERYSTGFEISTDLLSTIKATFGAADGETESSILDVLYSLDVFCLDDLGSEHHRGPEDWASEKIFQLISGRHAALKRTIITSNYSLDQLEDRLGHPRTVRRIVEATTPRWIIDFRRLPNLT